VTVQIVQITQAVMPYRVVTTADKRGRETSAAAAPVDRPAADLGSDARTCARSSLAVADHPPGLVARACDPAVTAPPLTSGDAAVSGFVIRWFAR